MPLILSEENTETTAGSEGVHAAHHSHEHDISTGAIVIILGILFYMSMGAYIEKNHLSIGHEASFTIVLGKLFQFHFL